MSDIGMEGENQNPVPPPQGQGGPAQTELEQQLAQQQQQYEHQQQLLEQQRQQLAELRRTADEQRAANQAEAQRNYQDRLDAATRASNMQFQTRDVPNLNGHSKEIKMGTPNDFDGDRSKAFVFESECLLYLMANAETYNTAEKKIAFMLSFMKKGAAAEWKLIKVYNYVQKGWPTDFDIFRKEWEETFLPVDAASDA
ncbi:hypothetical protein K435DRAFT_811812 [Dendrothele bispora CBS 962.96]|uniref:Retrotransposon gag domain-containing protein n=1 Tax=Dendrothele bispora (strain CBS 962.96) TaxID=1314807 RepID=A0A4S8KRZ8_DENBC|nr:hypothetical protein K435DRAFT_811812 [Dendrothele bispora CBS 962.96]